MMKHSAGIILYRKLTKPALDGSRWGVWLTHPGGIWNKNAPFSFSKGKIEKLDEDVLATALRELKEETGVDLSHRPATDFYPLVKKFTQSSHKQLSMFACEFEGEIANPPPSNYCEIEFPKGVMNVAPEIDQAKFFTLAEAKASILISQLPILEQLEEYLEKKDA